jgi:hypothetical protein
MTVNVLHELRKLGRSYPAKAEPIPVVMNAIGQIGHVENRRGVYVNSAIQHHVKTILREHEMAERVARECSNGMFGADDILPIAALGTDSSDAIRTIKSMRGALTSWVDVLTARSNMKYYDIIANKASIASVIANWTSYLSASGHPGAITYGAIPGPAAKSASDAGAMPLPVSLGASEDLYLVNFGANHQSGTNIVLLVDVLTANGSILTSIITSQNVSSTTLPRWTGGAGVLMTLEVQTAPGASTGIPNITVNYIDQSGNVAGTPTITQGVTSPAAGRMMPLIDGPMIRLSADDYGVRSVAQVTLSISSSGAGGALALIQYKPLLILPTISTLAFNERSTQAQAGGIRKITSVVQGSLPFLGIFALTSGTGTGVQTYMLETVWG